MSPPPKWEVYERSMAARLLRPMPTKSIEQRSLGEADGHAESCCGIRV
jgi:hypothetical protein